MISRGICFDMDGTLLDSGPEELRRFFRIARSRNLPLNPEIEAKVLSVWGQAATSLIKLAWPEENVAEFYKDWEDLDNSEPLPLFSGTKEALIRLRKIFYLSILTNRYMRTVQTQITRNDLEFLFEFIITPECGGPKKPDPMSMDPVFEKYQALGIDPKNVIYVGDTIAADWKLCQSIGIEFYAVLCGGMDTREKFLASGVPEDHILDSVADLPRILLKN